MEFGKAYITTMRPYLMFVSGITGIAGMSFHAATFPKSVLLFAACFLSYGFGQALTDCFQVDTDSISSPYRPLTQGKVSRWSVFATSAIGLSFCVAIFAMCNPLNIVLGAIGGLGLLTYTFFKRRWWGGPFYNAWIVGVLCMMAYLAGPVGLADIARWPFPWMVLTVFAGYANFVLVGYFKDIEADRATGYNTLPVVAGRATASRISDIFAMVTIGTATVAFILARQSSTSLYRTTASEVFFIAGVVSTIVAQVNLHQTHSDDEAYAAISPTVHSYILLLSGIAGALNPAWTPFLAFMYVAFCLTMHFRPARNQI
jgi:4-hydroxybenzoate polyprenyltransferase